jgi:hypothetical protein
MGVLRLGSIRATEGSSRFVQWDRLAALQMRGSQRPVRGLVTFCLCFLVVVLVQEEVEGPLERPAGEQGCLTLRGADSYSHSVVVGIRRALVDREKFGWVVDHLYWRY